MSQVIQTSVLPSVMEVKLRAIRRRQAMLAGARAVMIGASALLVAMLVAMMIDWSFTLFSTGVRTALTVGALTLAGVALVAAGLKPLVAALGWTRAAATADEAAPQLEERWTTVASFAGGNHRPNTPVAQAMLKQVEREAAAMGKLVEPRRAVRPTALRPALFCTLGCSVVLAGFLMLGGAQSSVLLRRFWNPWADITATQLRSVTGDVTIPRGETLELTTELEGTARHRATLTIEHESGVVDVFDLPIDQSRTFTHSLRVDDSFRYQVRAGDGQTGWRRVTAIDYPELSQVRFTITAPEYVDRPPLEKTLLPRRVSVIEGSRLVLLLKPQTEVERLQLTLTSPAEEEESEDVNGIVALDPDAKGWYRFEMQLVEDISLSPSLINVHGLTNQKNQVCSVQVIADQAPVARIISPTDEMAVAVDEEIEIKFEAHDDHGIATAELVVYDDSGEEGAPPTIVSVQPIPLGDQQLAKYVTATTRLDLEDLNLEPGARISYAIRVADNRKTTIDPERSSASIAEAHPGTPQAGSMPGDAADSEDAPNRKPADQEVAGGDARSNQQGQPEDTESDAEKMLAAVGPPFEKGDTTEDATKNAGGATTEDAHDSPSAGADKTDAAQSASRNVDVADSETRQGDADGTDATDRNDEPNEDPGPKGQSDPPPGDSRDDPKSEDRPPGNSADENPGADSTAAERNASAKPSAAAAPSDGGDAPGEPEQQQTPEGEHQHESNSDAEPATSAVSDSSDPESAPSDSPMPQESEGAASDKQRQTDNDEQSEADSDQKPSRSGTGSSANSQSSPPPISLNPQQSASGQNAETSRRRLTITDRLTAVAEAADRAAATSDIRDRVVQIDKMLAAIEAVLQRVVNREIPDADRSEAFQTLDVRLGDVEEYIAQLHNDTRDDELAFAGLQMVDIGRSHVTPARDRVFVAIRDPAGAEDYSAGALQHVLRARELLAALLERYDRVVRDRELAEALDETVTMYEVYVEKMQRLMRESRQNTNPLQRKMGVIEVDQEYLDRFAEVLTLRREMLAEFARMLADDPRLMSRYLDLIKRRRNSLRDQLSELAQRQDEIAVELSGWLQVDEAQRPDLWILLADMRLQATTDLAKDAAELAERIEKQAPLLLEPSQGTAAAVIGHGQEIARLARSISFEASKPLQAGEQELKLAPLAEQLVAEFGRLEAALDLLNFEHDDKDEVSDYVAARLLESRTVADQAVAWAAIARNLERKHYAGLAEVDQQKLSIATELLRVEMLAIEQDLDGQFQQQTESGLPTEIRDLVDELHHTMETVVFNQAASTFAMTQNKLAEAELQQAKAVAGFARAEELFDRIRRDVVDALDEYDVEDPNIADLVDPTLDEFLAQLEREPNIEAQLGIPNRPRNLRVIADALTWQQNGEAMLGNSGDAAAERAQEAMKKPRPPGGIKEPPERELTPQEREQMEKAKEMQDMLARSLAALDEKMKDPRLTPEERRKLEQMAESMRRMQDQLQQGPSERTWDELAESDQAKETLRALARGEAIPDQQWNKLLSTLEDGLWQVRGKTPPADYRKAIEQYQDRIRQLMDSGE